MDSEAMSSRWIKQLTSSSEARFRLFCFPYAGGGSAVFRSWTSLFPNMVEICAIQLPGRENHIMEDPIDSLPKLISSLTHEIIPFLADLPFAFYGHSMGAFIAFEMAQALRRQHLTEPTILFVGGQRAPQLPDPDPPVYALPDADFIDKLRHLQGTPEEILQNDEILDLALPMLRADFTLCETYDYHEEEPLAYPIVAFGGQEDTEISIEQLAQWNQQTSALFQLYVLPGNHFFLQSEPNKLVHFMYNKIATLLVR